MSKKNPADLAADEYFELQMSRSRRSRVTDIILLGLLCAIMLAVALCVWLAPQSDFSERENRHLQTLEGIAAADDPMKAIADMYADQFPFRTSLVEAKAYIELAGLKMENNGVILGHSGALIAKPDYSPERIGNAEQNAEAVARFDEVMTEKGIKVTVATAPRQIDALKKYLPATFGESENRAAELLDGEGVERIALGEAISAQKGYTWFLTDHHWTPLGAYYAYAALGDELGYTPLPLSEFRAETVSREFYGTVWSKSGIYAASPDEITLYRYDGDTDFKVTDADSGEVYLEGLYDKSKLEIKDKYSLFLGGDYGHVKISDGSEKPTLLVIKDSYFDALAPFLARHFELDVIDLRYTSARDSVAEYATEQGIDNILILFGEDSDSLLAATTLTKLKFKLK